MKFINIHVNGESLVLSEENIQLVLRGFSIENEIVLGSYTVPLEAPVCQENDVVFKHQSLLENSETNRVINNAELFIGGISIAQGYLLLLNATARNYRFSFIYKPLSNIFFNRNLREIIYRNDLFWYGHDLPKTYAQYMSYLQERIITQDVYINQAQSPYCLFTVKTPNWTELPAGIFETDGMEQNYENRRINLINASTSALVKNFVEVVQEDANDSDYSIDGVYHCYAFNTNKIVPFVYSAFILESIWQEDGWKVKGDLMQWEPFLRDIQLNSFALDRYVEAGCLELTWNGDPLALYDKLPLKLDYGYDLWYNDATKLFNIPGSILAVADPDFPAVMCAVVVTLTFLTSVDGEEVRIRFNQGGSVYYTGIGIGVGNTVSVYILSEDGALRSIRTDTDFFLEFIITTIPTGSLALESLFAKLYLCDNEGNYEHSNTLTRDFNYQNHVPDMTAGEFIKSILKRFGATQKN